MCEKTADPWKADTGLFFFRGEPGAKTAIVNAGGAFSFVGTMQDSFPHCLELTKMGYNAFAMIYRPGWITAMEDLGRAIAFLWDHQEELEIDMNGYSLWGGSAGARMAATLGELNGCLAGRHARTIDQIFDLAILLRFRDDGQDAFPAGCPWGTGSRPRSSGSRCMAPGSGCGRYESVRHAAELIIVHLAVLHGQAHAAETEIAVDLRENLWEGNTFFHDFINEALKARDQMAWVGRMNSIRQRAEESILEELIYA